MKKIFLLIVCMFLLIGTVSAFEFDNKLTYSNDDLKVNLNNWWGLGKNYGTAELKSHPSIDYVKQVGLGSQVVMWYDFNFMELYSKGIGNPEFKDMRTGKTVDRDYSFVYWGEKQRNIYSEVCDENNLNVNGTDFN